MNKYLCAFIAFFWLSASNARAQAAEDSVKAVIKQMFAAMKNADSVSLKSVFADSALLQSISRNNEGKTIVKNEPVDEFITIVGKQPSGASDERITFEYVKADDLLASAWTPYAFYYNGQLHHCGVNSFQLVRINNIWKIQYIIDTRRKDVCPVDVK